MAKKAKTEDQCRDSMEEEVQPILRNAVGHRPHCQNLASIIRARFGLPKGVGLEVPSREPARGPASFE